MILYCLLLYNIFKQFQKGIYIYIYTLGEEGEGMQQSLVLGF